MQEKSARPYIRVSDADFKRRKEELMIFDLPPPDPTLEISVASRGYSKGLAKSDGVQILIRPEVAFGSLRLGPWPRSDPSRSADNRGWRYAPGRFESRCGYLHRR